MKKITLHDLIYIAGFLDGDGCIMAQLITRPDYKLGFQIRLTVQFTQSSKREIYLQKLKDILGIGYIRNRNRVNIGASPQLGGLTNRLTSDGSNYQTNGLINPVCDYIITEPKNVYMFLKEIQPYLRMKQKQANLVLTIIEQLPLAKDSPSKFIELAHMVDHVASLNDSKNRKVTATHVEAILKCKFPKEE